MTLEDFSNRLISPSVISERLSKFRHWLQENSLDGYILSHNDNFFSEYPPSYAHCLYWLSGFSGSCGSGLIFMDKALLFTDGRYQSQAREQVCSDLYEIKHMLLCSAQSWLIDNLASRANIGYNPNLFNINIYNKWRDASLINSNINLVSISSDPFSSLWSDRPAAPSSPLKPHKIEYSGVCVSDKKSELCSVLKKQKCDAAIISDPADIAWLCNIRGSDISYTPIALLRAILSCDGVLTLFVDESRLTISDREVLLQDIFLKPESCFLEMLSKISQKPGRIIIDYDSLPLDYYEILASSDLIDIVQMRPDFCCLRRACKNDTEIDGSIKAHIEDGVSMCRFIYFYHKMMSTSSPIDEISASAYLAKLRSSSSLFRDLSFPSISASGSNGTIMHYRVDLSSNTPIKPDIPYLIDSGGQYVCGTTDVTRTLLHRFDSSKPGLSDFTLHYTLVLKALIGISVTKFPAGSAAALLDGICRSVLWQYGLNYDHGTGHGVGSYLQVHEAGQTISSRNISPLKAGMIVSLEPGYYPTNQYGIRLENLALVEYSDEHKNFLRFKILTLVPFERCLLKISLLDEAEKQWLNNYHARCFSTLSPFLDEAETLWLKSATKKLSI